MNALSQATGPKVAISVIKGRARLQRDENVARRNATIEIDQEQATILAARFIERFGSFQKSWIEKFAGVPIVVSRLTPCRTTRYAASAFDPQDLRALPNHIRQRYGAQWIIPICDGSSLRAMVGVAADADPNAITPEKGILMPKLQTGGFFVAGIGEANGRWLLDEPELAVMYVASQTGAKVIETPRLVVMPRSLTLRPFWRVELDRSIETVNDDDGLARRDSVLYVGGSDTDEQIVPLGAALYVGVDDPTRKPKKEPLSLGDLPSALRKDASQTLEVFRVIKVNGKYTGDLKQ